MTIAVTGATGQLGRIVIEKLKAKVPASDIVRSGSVCLNSFGRFAKWITASIMPPPSLVSAR